MFEAYAQKKIVFILCHNVHYMEIENEQRMRRYKRFVVCQSRGEPEQFISSKGKQHSGMKEKSWQMSSRQSLTLETGKRNCGI